MWSNAVNLRSEPEYPGLRLSDIQSVSIYFELMLVVADSELVVVDLSTVVTFRNSGGHTASWPGPDLQLQHRDFFFSCIVELCPQSCPTKWTGRSASMHFISAFQLQSRRRQIHLEVRLYLPDLSHLSMRG